MNNLTQQKVFTVLYKDGEESVRIYSPLASVLALAAGGLGLKRESQSTESGPVLELDFGTDGKKDCIFTLNSVNCRTTTKKNTIISSSLCPSVDYVKERTVKLSHILFNLAHTFPNTILFTIAMPLNRFWNNMLRN